MLAASVSRHQARQANWQVSIRCAGRVLSGRVIRRRCDRHATRPSGGRPLTGCAYDSPLRRLRTIQMERRGGGDSLAARPRPHDRSADGAPLMSLPPSCLGRPAGRRVQLWMTRPGRSEDRRERERFSCPKSHRIDHLAPVQHNPPSFASAPAGTAPLQWWRRAGTCRTAHLGPWAACEEGLLVLVWRGRLGFGSPTRRLTVSLSRAGQAADLGTAVPPLGCRGRAFRLGGVRVTGPCGHISPQAKPSTTPVPNPQPVRNSNWARPIRGLPPRRLAAPPRSCRP
jgi:hypothetical protein